MKIQRSYILTILLTFAVPFTQNLAFGQDPAISANANSVSIFDQIVSLHESGHSADLETLSKSQFASGRCFYRINDKPKAALLAIQQVKPLDVGPISQPPKAYQGLFSFDLFGKNPPSFYDADGLSYDDLKINFIFPIIRQDSRTHFIDQRGVLEGDYIYLRSNASYVTALRYNNNLELIMACYFFKFH